MKEFSALIPEDRKFEVGGEVFEWVTPYWEVLARIFDEDLGEAMQALAEEVAPDGEKATEASGANGQVTDSRDNVLKTQQRIAVFIAEKDQARWWALCERKEDPVPMFIYPEVFRWLMEVATGRPTQPPSDSEPGGGNGEASSPAASRSRAGSRRR